MKSQIKSLFRFLKSLKNPPNSMEEVKVLNSQAKKYLLGSLISAILIVAIVNLLSNTKIVFLQIVNYICAIIGFLIFILVIICLIALLAAANQKQRFKNLTCNNCKADLRDSEHVSFQEISRKWEISKDDKRTLYITIKITCICPNCKEEKSFQVRLRATENGEILSTQKLVEDYMNGYIHG